MFAEPAPTQFDINFRIGRIPVRVHPFFWLIAILFSINGGGVMEGIIWVIVIFVSILIHELGHSWAMRWYGRDSYIVLHSFGGLAIEQGSSLGNFRLRSTREQLIISFAGPLAGFIFAGITFAGFLAYAFATGLSSLFFAGAFTGELSETFAWMAVNLVTAILWINIAWGIMNLMPVFPLDGGQIARAIFMHRDPWDGPRRSLWLSVVTGGLIAIASIALFQSFYMAFLFGILAYQSYQIVSRI